ncbi:MAG: FKBP-type peptidyl-prolyl cis-trans isomerase [Bacteroidota bacterium]
MRRSGWAFFALFALVVTGCLDKAQFDTAAQMTTDIATIDAYLQTNNITNVIKDQSGLRFAFTTVGTGFPPRVEQTVKVNYTGKFLSGTVFDPGPTITSPLGSFILGWQYGLSVWPKGSKGQLYVPSPFGYGNNPGNSAIPPNSILMFEVELVDVIPSNADKARMIADVDAIDTFLDVHNIEATQDSTGIRYVITNQGTGPKPTWFQKLKFNYTGKVMSTGNQIATGSSAPGDLFDSRMVDFIAGIQFGLSKIGTGGKITVYIPSGLAFAAKEDTSTNLQANSILIYDLELTEIVAD